MQVKSAHFSAIKVSIGSYFGPEVRFELDNRRKQEEPLRRDYSDLEPLNSHIPWPNQPKKSGPLKLDFKTKYDAYNYFAPGSWQIKVYPPQNGQDKLSLVDLAGKPLNALKKLIETVKTSKELEIPLGQIDSYSSIENVKKQLDTWFKFQSAVKSL